MPQLKRRIIKRPYDGNYKERISSLKHYLRPIDDNDLINKNSRKFTDRVIFSCDCLRGTYEFSKKKPARHVILRA